MKLARPAAAPKSPQTGVYLRAKTGRSLASLDESALPDGMEQGEQAQGLQRVLLNERARLLRFLAARGAGDDAEDVFQDLWQRVVAVPVDSIAEPVSYLFRAAENLLRDRRRSNLSRQRRQHDWYEATAATEEMPTGERALIARQRLREVENVLAALGPRVDRVFRRYRLDGVGQAVIASELGISLSSVEKDLQKAYRALAELKVRLDAE
ncbi:sigma-70 family RNA polymerase sigma factor [Tsuneonella sp. CC-YZS046]|uniref:RNA polymerase sigma factor n=1 Tax=Tsuneonella sp. CC-YZS046 TaxID=3042152 RepID=UPI002D775AEC|nr:sigma-70 family RNA polymerase sigma factor [Tsuneonella sp. CC-YZS046]WRO65581.1 sigma-70 family RNA polymerase sigma factor [Tsuneonella sp. CC-YZS046]